MNVYRISFLTLALSIVFMACSSDNSPEPEPEPTPQITEVEVELLSFAYTPQMGNTPDRLQYEIRFTNNNDVAVQGFYRVTTLATFGVETLESTLLSSDESICYQIEANASCIFSFDETYNIDSTL